MFNRKEAMTSAFHRYRRDSLKAFDIYKTNVIYGIETETPEERDILMAWYREMLDFPEQINENTTWADFPKLPEKLKDYT